jgi:hypothetical protein
LFLRGFKGASLQCTQQIFNKQEIKMALTSQQNRLAERINKKVLKILKHNGDDTEVLVGLTSYMNDFKALMDCSTELEMTQLCNKFDGFYRYAKILENLAGGIQSGEIPVPR